MRLYTYLLKDIPAEFKAEHRGTWYVWAGSSKIRHESTMRGTWGWDVVCSCGWESHTGGATKGSVKEDHAEHIHDAEFALELREQAIAAGYDPDDQASYSSFLLTLHRDQLRGSE